MECTRSALADRLCQTKALTRLGDSNRPTLKIKRTLETFLALGLCLGVAACAWAYYGSPSSASTTSLPIDAAPPGRLWAYRVPFPFDDLDSVTLEIRRSSERHDADFTVGSVDGGLIISHEDAEMKLSTGRISSARIRDGVSVATWLIELDDVMTAPPAQGQWRIAGNVRISGVSSSISPQDDFCLGESVSAAWERIPNWTGTEMCVGRFRTNDDERIYDYYCVLVAAGSKSRQPSDQPKSR